MGRKSSSAKRKNRYTQYKAEKRNLKNKASRLARKIKHYKIQPPLMLKGIRKTNKELAELIERKLCISQ